MNHQPQDRYHNAYPSPESRSELPPPTHHALGIISFVLGLIVFFGGIGGFGYLVVALADGMEQTESMELKLGVAILFFVALALVGLVLGIIGCVQKNTKKVFAIMGISFSALTLFAIVFIVGLGLMIGE